MGETMGRIIWRLSPFIILITGFIAAVIVFNWAGRIGVSTYQIPADSPYWLPGKQVGFASAGNWLFSLLLMPLVLMLFVLALVVVEPSVSLFIIGIVFTLSGPVEWLWRRRTGRPLEKVNADLEDSQAKLETENAPSL